MRFEMQQHMQSWSLFRPSAVYWSNGEFHDVTVDDMGGANFGWGGALGIFGCFTAWYDKKCVQLYRPDCATGSCKF